MPANIKTIELRNLQIEDYKELKKSMVESYPEMADSFWKEDQIELLLKIPRRTISIVVDGIVVDRHYRY
jgi:two-component SAPR family response regulator